MNDPKQLIIMFKLTDHLEGITPANGYDFDLAGHVFRGRASFGADERVPFVSILEAPRPDNRPLEVGPENLKRQEDWELLVQGWATENRDYPTDDLYRLKACVEKRLAQIAAMGPNGNPLYPAVYRLGGLLASIRIGPGVVRAATPQVGGAEAFYLPVTLRYVINVADPYAIT